MSDLHIIDMVTMYCSHCGIPFSIPKYYDAVLQRGDKRFYCPNGHTMQYATPKEEQPDLLNKIEELKNQNKELEQRLENVSLSETTTTKGVIIERRVERKASFTNAKAAEYLKSLKKS